MPTTFREAGFTRWTGCFFFEVQQNSDTTYRIYDWDRTDENGEHRRLHIEEALQVIAWDDREDPRIQPERIERDDGNAWWLLKACPHFRIERVDLLRRSTLSSDGRSFRVVFVVAGSVLLAAGGHELSLRRGMTCLLPAALESCRLVPEGRRKPSAELLLTTR